MVPVVFESQVKHFTFDLTSWFDHLNQKLSWPVQFALPVKFPEQHTTGVKVNTDNFHPLFLGFEPELGEMQYRAYCSKHLQ